MNDEFPKRFTGWFIPRDVVELYIADKLTQTEVFLLAMIDCLVGERGCYASNEYLAKQLRMKEDTVSKAVSRLIKMELLEQVAFNGRQRILVACWSEKAHQTRIRILARLGSRSDAESDENQRVVPMNRDSIDKKITDAPKARVGESGGGGFFGEAKQFTFPEKAAKRLEGIVRAARKHSPTANTKNWPKEFEQLMKDGVDKDRIKTAVDWYADAIGQEFVPQIYSAKAFRTKFDALESAMARKDKKAARTSPGDVPDTVQAIYGSLILDLTWPKGSKTQLIECIMQSCSNYDKTREMVIAWRDRLKLEEEKSGWESGLPGVLTAMLDIYLKGVDAFVEQWFREVHRQVTNWAAWSGELRGYIFTPTHKLFQRRFIEYGGDVEALQTELTSLNAPADEN